MADHGCPHCGYTDGFIVTVPAISFEDYVVRGFDEDGKVAEMEHAGTLSKEVLTDSIGEDIEFTNGTTYPGDVPPYRCRRCNDRFSEPTVVDKGD